MTNAPSTDTQTLIEALRILARDIQSDDGVANAAIAEAALRLQELDTENGLMSACMMNVEKRLEGLDIERAPFFDDYVGNALLHFRRMGRIEATAWQPIETAPKDGTKVLLLEPLSFYCKQKNYIFTGHFYDYEKRWVCNESHTNDHEPTHWMPLPEPPEDVR